MKIESTAEPPTIYVVDDDEEMRLSLCGLLEAMGFRTLGFASATQFRRAFRTNQPGCLVLDIQMPRETGLQMYERMLRERQHLPVIFITGHADVTTAVAAMKTGAVEFLEKPFDRRTLLDRIEKALAMDWQWRMREREIADIEHRMAKLSSRERETLDLLLAGESNKLMAAKLFISERAVEMRRAGIMRKLEVRSLAELLNLTVTQRVLAEVRQAKLKGPDNQRL